MCFQSFDLQCVCDVEMLTFANTKLRMAVG